MTWEITKLSSFEHINGKTIVDITLPPEGSTFVVFRESSDGLITVNPNSIKNQPNILATISDKAETQVEIKQNGTYILELPDGATKTIEVNSLPNIIDLSENWNVAFPDVKSGEVNVSLLKLTNWVLHPDDNIKYYSGTAIYSKEFVLSKKALKKAHKLTLDLGVVNVVAKVSINGTNMGTFWIKPFALDVTSVLKSGKNEIEIQVTNQWTNRLIGDENYPNVSGYNVQMDKMPEWHMNNEPGSLGQRSTFTVYPFYKKGDALLPAGLLGPVTIKSSKVILNTLWD